MPGLTQAGQQIFLRHMLGKVAWPMGAPFVALTTTAPTDAAAGAEATYTGYARKSTVGTDWNDPTAATPSVATNAARITFAACSALTATVTHFELYDALTGGNRIAFGALTASLAVSAGISPDFAIGQLILTAD